MSTTALTAWYDYVLPRAPGCPEAIAMQAIRDAAIEFCQKTWAMNRVLDTVSATATVADVELDAGDDDAVVEKVLEVWFNGIKITSKGPDELERLLGHDWTAKTGTPRFYTQYSKLTLILAPIPESDLSNAIKIRAAMKPTDTAAVIDTEIYREYREAIRDGALARLYDTEKMPYSNAKKAEQKKLDFEAEIASVRRAVQRGFGRRQGSVTSHFL